MPSELSIVLGRSGGGKTTSLRNLDPASTVIFNTVSKRLPFPNAKAFGGRLVNGQGNDPHGLSAQILHVLDTAHAAPHIRLVVIDDYQYVMALSYAQGRRVGEGWTTYDRIFYHAVDVFTKATSLRDDLDVVIMSHTQEKSDIVEGNRVSMKTIGNQLEDKFTPEGMSTVLLITDNDLSKADAPLYRFRTNGASPAKSPMGMFPLFIPNDLAMVLDRKREYYEKGTPIGDSPVLKEAMAKAGMNLDGTASTVFG